MADNLIYPHGNAVVTVPAGQSIAVYSQDAFVFQPVIATPNYPPVNGNPVAVSKYTSTVFGPYASGSNVNISSGSSPVYYQVGAVPLTESAKTVVFSTDASGNVTGLVGSALSNSINKTMLTTVLVGDSISANQGIPPVLTSQSYFSWANCMAGQPFEVIGNTGVAGQTSAYVLATEVPLVIALSPTHAEVMAGTNDLAVLTTAQTIANLKAIYTQLNNAGIYVRAYSILPRALSGALMGQVNYVNSFIREFWRNKVGGEYIDAFSSLINPTSTTGAMVTNASADAVHPNTYGAYLIANTLAPALRRWVTQSILPVSATDDQSVVTGGLNLAVNPLFAGTGGTAVVGTGTVATGYTVTGTVSGSTASLIANPSGYGQNQQLVLTANAAGQAANIVMANDAHLLAVVGKKYYAVAEVTVTANPTNLQSIDLFINNNGVLVAKTLSNTANGNVPILANTTFTMRTPLFTLGVPSTYLAAQVAASFSGVGGATISVGRFALYQSPDY